METKDSLLLWFAVTYDSEIGTLEVIWQTVAKKPVLLVMVAGKRKEILFSVVTLRQNAGCYATFVINAVLPCNRENEYGGN